MRVETLLGLLGLACLLTGAVVATGAFTGSDTVGGGIYLKPAASDNGGQYAAIDGSGELRIEMQDLPPHATTVADRVFNVSTDLQRASVWIEDGEPAVSFYRMDSRTQIESPANAVTLTNGETVSVGMKVESGSPTQLTPDLTVHAEVPDSGGSNNAGQAPDPDPATPTPQATPETPTPTEPTTPGDGEPGGNTTPTETPTPQAGAPGETPDDQPFEIAGLSGTTLLTITATGLFLIMALVGRRWLRSG
jgi:hypothetical protein